MTMVNLNKILVMLGVWAILLFAPTLVKVVMLIAMLITLVGE